MFTFTAKTVATNKAVANNIVTQHDRAVLDDNEGL